MSDMPMDSQVVGGLTIVRFPADTSLDFLTVDSVAESLHLLAERARTPVLVIDFSNVKFVTSAALTMLLNVRRTAEPRNMEVVLCGLRTDIARILRLTRLDKLFRCFPSLSAAQQTLGAGGPRDSAAQS